MGWQILLNADKSGVMTSHTLAKKYYYFGSTSP